MNRMAQLFSSFNERMGNRPVLAAVRRGLTYMIPLVLVGSMALVLLSLPIPAYQRAMAALFGTDWSDTLLYVRDGTFNVLSLIMVACISHSYAVEADNRGEGGNSPIVAATVSLGSFIAVLGISREGFRLSGFGVVGMFAAIVVAVTSSMLFRRLSLLRFMRIRSFGAGADAVFNHAVSSVLPAAVTILCFALVNQLLLKLFDISNLQSFLSGLFTGLFANIKSPVASALLFILLIHVLWFFGIHGNNVLEPVAQSIFTPALEVNRQLAAAGQMPTEIFTKTFFDTFVLMGGCGTALCLIGAVVIAGRHKNQHRLARLSILPVLFNINELVVFGMPIVLNPVFFLPFLVVPVLLTAVSYLAMRFGLVPYTTRLVEWTTPVFLSGYASTGSLAGSALQLVNLALGVLCYVPFVKLAEVVSDARMKHSLNRFYRLFRQDESRGTVSALLTRHDEIGSIARFLAADFEHDLRRGRLNLHYQPQVDSRGRVTGVEALLRWHHESYGLIYPPLVVALAEESQTIHRLGNWIFRKACEDLRTMREAGQDGIRMSVNVSAAQLENEGLVEELRAILGECGVRHGSLQIEITEQAALTHGKAVIDRIRAIKALGVGLAMDDFGMGHSSLMYLKEYEFDTVKLDGSLVRELQSNGSCRSIISSIVYLGKSMNYTVVAEYVENEIQRAILHDLGCDCYQGYLFSPAVPLDALVGYIAGGAEEEACERAG